MQKTPSMSREKYLQMLVDEGQICKYEYNRTHVLCDVATGEIRDLNCKSWRCPKHRGSWKHKWYTIVAREIKEYPVDKLITLTCASEASP